jgi:hypothetical protein
MSSIEDDLNQRWLEIGDRLGGVRRRGAPILRNHPQERSEVESAIPRAASRFSKMPDPANPESWESVHYVEVAFELGLISQETKTQALLAKDFRNLIHLGREKRKAMKCSRGTARSAAAAVDHVLADLERRLPVKKSPVA